ncbi:MAG: non-canonical purine NTP diphosphatase [Microscillaceae bacterium]
MKKLCFATRNLNKIAEMQAFLGQNFWPIVSIDEIGCLDELAETTGTIEGNSAQKAAYVWENFEVNVFADDSGLEIEALQGRPGVDSAHYAGTRDAAANIAKVLHEMEGAENRKARFKTVISLYWESQFYQFTGLVSGQILTEIRGKGGFGYDPIFMPDGHSQAFAEMSLEYKNQISHRALALAQLKSFLLGQKD